MLHIPIISRFMQTDLASPLPPPPPLPLLAPPSRSSSPSPALSSPLLPSPFHSFLGVGELPGYTPCVSSACRRGGGGSDAGANAIEQTISDVVFASFAVFTECAFRAALAVSSSNAIDGSRCSRSRQCSDPFFAANLSDRIRRRGFAPEG